MVLLRQDSVAQQLLLLLLLLLLELQLHLLLLLLLLELQLLLVKLSLLRQLLLCSCMRKRSIHPQLRKNRREGRQLLHWQDCDKRRRCHCLAGGLRC